MGIPILDHLKDAVKHITGAERTAWNAKPNKDHRAATFVIGNTGAGHTLADCDYLCDGTDDQNEINTAITALSASGGSILFLSGNYNIANTINVNKAKVELLGANGASITAVNVTSYIYITAANCTVRNLTLVGSQTGDDKTILKAYNIKRTMLLNLRVTKANITLDTCSESIAQGCNIGEANSYNKGIVLLNGTGNLVTGNNVSEAYYGVHAITEKKLTVANNQSTVFNEFGMRFDTCEDLLVTGNNLSTSVGGYITGMSFLTCSRVNICSNMIDMYQVTDTYFCVYASECNRLTIYANIFRNISTGACVSLDTCSYGHIFGNLLTCAGTATSIGSSTNVTVTDNITCPVA